MSKKKKKIKEEMEISKEELAERYVASLLLLSEEYKITPEKAHEGVTELLEEVEIDICLDDLTLPETKH